MHGIRVPGDLLAALPAEVAEALCAGVRMGPQRGCLGVVSMELELPDVKRGNPDVQFCQEEGLVGLHDLAGGFSDLFMKNQVARK
jgi:hypothetical protein